MSDEKNARRRQTTDAAEDAPPAFQAVLSAAVGRAVVPIPPGAGVNYRPELIVM